MLAWMVPADAPRVFLDCRQGGIKGCEGAMLDAGHGLQSVAGRADCELLGRRFGDPAHGAAKQVRQVPCPAVVGWCHDHIQAYLPFPHCAWIYMGRQSHT